MADVYTRAAATSARLITKYGRSLSLKTEAFTGATPWAPTVTPTSTTITGVVSDYQQKDIDGTLIQAGDKKFVISSAVVPTLAGRIVDGSLEYSIVSVTEIKPGATAVLYIVQGRK